MGTTWSVVKWTERRWQAVGTLDGQIVVACGHDDHKTKRDATQCTGRLMAAN